MIFNITKHVQKQCPSLRNPLVSTTKNMKNKTTNAAQVTAATLDNLMQQDAATGETKSLDNPWRNAEAYHLLLLAHRQLYRGKPLLALITASKLLYSDVEDVLDMSTVYSLVALSAFYTDHFESCSRAFILLSSLSSTSHKRSLNHFQCKHLHIS